MSSVHSTPSSTSASNARPSKESKEPPDGEAFERYLQQGCGAEAVAGRQGREQQGSSEQDELDRDAGTAGAGALWLGPLMPGGAPPAANAAPAHGSLAWNEVSAYIDRLLVGADGVQGAGPAAIFSLSQSLLADTTVSLTRKAGGWALRIQTTDTELLDDAQRHETTLCERFAERGLGQLTVEHGEVPAI
jgi:hypothetical protein